MPDNVTREFAEKSAERVKDTYGKAQAAAEETTKVMERASKGAADFNLHLLEITQENINAAFDFARHITRVKSPSELFELSAAYTRKQFETFAEQTRHLTTLAQKVTTDVAQPLQSEVAKTFKKSA